MKVLITGGAGFLGHRLARRLLEHGSLGAEPIAYGDGMPDRVRAVAPNGVDRALDVAGNRILPQLIELAGGTRHVLTIADVDGAKRFGVRFSRGDDGRALYALREVAALFAAGRFTLPPVKTFPLANVAEAHRVGESGHAAGKLILTVA